MAKWPYSTAQWGRLRKIQLQTEPLCRYCDLQGRVTRANTVDHIQPVSQRPDLAFDQDNLQSLCPTCHSSAKQAEERGDRIIGGGRDGLPIDPLSPWSQIRDT